MPHLQRLDQKFAFDHAADPGLEVEEIIPAPTLVRDPDEHAFDLPDEIGTTARLAPELPRERFKFKTERTADARGAGQRLQLPKLRARFVVDAEGFERTNERPFLAIRTQTGIERGETAFRARLRQAAIRFCAARGSSPTKRTSRSAP